MKRVALIMAGGSGERFWPQSRKHFPKQLLHLNSEENSMLKETLMRVSSLIPIENVFIITTELLCENIRKCLTELPPENVIPEPEKRNTAPCLSLSSAFLQERFANEIDISVATLTADHNIYPTKKFIETIQTAMEHAEQYDKIVTIGISPTRPDTGYGYIETETPFYKNEIAEIKPVLRFREKPNLEQAKSFLETERFTWNSGMFFWKLSTFGDEIKKYSTELYDAIHIFRNLLKNKTNTYVDRFDNELANIYCKLPAMSIDYVLMEKSNNVVVCKSLFEWDDIGSWDSLFRTKKLDNKGNVLQGKLSVLDCQTSILINGSKDKDIILAGLGLTDIVVVSTDDAILVCHKDKVQSIKNIVEDIRHNYGDNYL
jgi:mannose-1-phosphate guanylyltransferase